MTTDLKHTVRLARVDILLIMRNRSALTNAVLMPLLVAGFLIFTARAQAADQVPFMLTGQVATLALFAPLVNLAGFYTTRREELILKRLLGGPASATAILGGSAAGATAVYLLQVVALCVAAVPLGVGLPENPLLLLAGVLGAAALFSLISMVISGFSSTGELAQIATVPFMFLCLFLSPAIVPLDALPEQLGRIAEYLPMTPVTELIRTGFLGDEGEGGGVLPNLGLLAAWVAVAAVVARRWFRWDPRRG
ncbi:transport permease protein [Actinoplanes capillaceus]|uniref:Transport permease protein n=1 Tax=Actinoplanes campanulatus TaxID=113559 RepID=A0ABQ3WS33_9ACTN|nr:ABC transporter permease [Actinoplanes capillaceus]GID49084.1 transport permease protein [Actinoplanes capillaceus]